MTDQRMVIYTRNPYWTKRASVQPKMDGWVVGSDPEDVIRHELGHWHHDRRIKWDKYHTEFTYDGRTYSKNLPHDYFEAKSEREIMARVSRYPAEARSNNRLEFVAEVYTGRRKGVEYDSEVMALYRKWGGPDV